MKHFLEEVALVLSQIRLGLCGSPVESYHSRAEDMYRVQGLTWKGREHLGRKERPKVIGGTSERPAEENRGPLGWGKN